MSNLKSLFLSLCATTIWLITAGLALAQPNQPASSGGGGGGDSMAYVLPYMVVILALVLGMLVVARSSSRREREKPAGYVEKKVMGDE
jgi:hypothetical protein